jgi:putative toxin-antitoxin system antitoxin component (TIGR02293 family)
MMQPDRIAEVMGGAAILGSRILSAQDLEAAVVTGLPKRALRLTLARACSSAQRARALLYRVVPEATYKRRTRLSAAESERTERIARIVAAAEYVWDNRDDAREWLTRPHPELENRSPLEAALTELGARRAEELLDRLFYGIPG